MLNNKILHRFCDIEQTTNHFVLVCKYKCLYVLIFNICIENIMIYSIII